MADITTTPEVTALPEHDIRIKNTFVHFEEDVSDSEQPPLRRSEATRSTCPDLVQRNPFRTKTYLRRRDENKVLLHESGMCRPCAYYVYKGDSCWVGDDCEYCHLCTKTQIRRRKRQFAAAKDIAVDAMTATLSTASTASTVSRSSFCSSETASAFGCSETGSDPGQ